MIVADTHALLWWILSPQTLSLRARTAMDERAKGVAAITLWEIAMLVSRGRVVLQYNVADWLQDVMALPQMAMLPLNIQVAATSAALPDLIRDPADRMIVATALHQGVPLVTKDDRIRESGIVQTIW